MKYPKLDSKLLSYSVLSASFLVAQQDAVGQAVYYTDLIPDIEIDGDTPSGYDEFNVDVNQDGVDDFTLYARDFINIWSSWGYRSVGIAPLGANSVAQTLSFASCTDSIGSLSTGYHQMAQAMSVGEVVGSTLNWTNANREMRINPWCSCYYLCDLDYEQFTGVKYIAIQVDDAGNSHYGWIRVAVNGSDEMTVFEFALNAIPNTPLTITAGAYSNCPEPPSLSTAFSGPSSAVLSWTGISSADKYLLTGRRVGTPGSYSKVVLTNSKGVGGLTSGSTYEWQVRTQCLDGAISPLSVPNTFTVPAPLEAIESYESTLRVVGSNASTASFELAMQEAGELRLSLFNLAGILLEERSFAFDKGLNRLDLAHSLPAGFYFVSVSQNGQRETVGLTISD